MTDEDFLQRAAPLEGAAGCERKTLPCPTCKVAEMARMILDFIDHLIKIGMLTVFLGWMGTIVYICRKK